MTVYGASARGLMASASLIALSCAAGAQQAPQAPQQAPVVQQIPATKQSPAPPSPQAAQPLPAAQPKAAGQTQAAQPPPAPKQPVAAKQSPPPQSAPQPAQQVPLEPIIVKTPLDGVVVTTSKATAPATPPLPASAPSAGPAIASAAPARAENAGPQAPSAPTAIDALSGASAVSRQQLDTQFQANQVSTVLRTVPGVITQETARDTATAINIRGLQDFGRVNVLIEGARQNFQRSGHAANGVFYMEPEMIKRVDITRGPTATVYGSGAIGGVAAFELLDADDILQPGEMMAGRVRERIGTNPKSRMTSGTGAVKIGNFDVLTQITGRKSWDYSDGKGVDVSGSNDETQSKLAKVRWRFGEGHQVTGTALDFKSTFVDQVEEGGSLRDSTVSNQQYTLGYTFSNPSTPLVDFSAKAYKNVTTMEQVRQSAVTVPRFTPSVAPFVCPGPPFPISAGVCMSFVNFPAGAARSFGIVTEGFDAFNTSRLDFGQAKLALTYGADAFRDKVATFDPTEGGDELTPGGQRQVSGAFVQAILKLFDTFDIIGAMRHDSYKLEGKGTENTGERISPKATIGYTPLKGFTFFGTYAEAFRAPAVTETLVSGTHAPPADFRLTPNPNLLPEVAHNFEFGVNVKLDGIIVTGDAFRAKAVAFRNKVDDYIDQVFVEGALAGIFTDDTLQYQNLNKVQIEGIEFEAAYDARVWFLGLGAHRIRGINLETDEGLYSIPPDQITLTAGVRPMGDRLTAGARVRLVGAQERFTAAPGDDIRRHADGYTILDLFGQYQLTDFSTIHVNIDNVFDKNYRQHLDQYNSAGLNARVGATIRLGAGK